MSSVYNLQVIIVCKTCCNIVHRINEIFKRTAGKINSTLLTELMNMFVYITRSYEIF